MATTHLGAVLWEMKSLKYFAINAGYSFVALVAMSLILLYMSLLVQRKTPTYVGVFHICGICVGKPNSVTLEARRWKLDARRSF